MSQHDMDIANASGAAVRADLNLALVALVGLNSGATAPATMFAYMLWADTTSGWLKQRNAANSAWIEMFRLSDIAFKDSTFAVVDDSDTTKKLILQLSSITTGTTRTITVPDASITMAGINTPQTFTSPQRATITTDNDASFNQSVTNNFFCTPTGAAALTFTNHTAGQSGLILFVNGSNYAITAAATTYIAAADLAKLSATGTYLIAYLDDGTNAYCAVTAALTSAGV